MDPGLGWDRVLPADLGGAAHHQHVPRTGPQVVGRTLVVVMDVAVAAGAQEPRPPRPQREQDDHRVVEPPQVPVTVERLQVTSVPVERQPVPVEPMAVSLGQGVLRVAEDRVRVRAGALPGRT